MASGAVGGAVPQMFASNMSCLAAVRGHDPIYSATMPAPAPAPAPAPTPASPAAICFCLCGQQLMSIKFPYS